MPKVAVIGCGYWGENHIRTLKNLGVLYSVSDSCSEKAAYIADKYQVKAYAPEEMLQIPEINAVILALPPQYHADYAIRAIQNGKDVFIEKPISLDIVSAQNIIAYGRKYQKIVMVGHLLRFHPAFEKLLSLYESGIIGELRYLYAHRLGFGRFHKESDALWDLAPHDLSMMLAITKKNPKTIIPSHNAVINKLNDFSHLHMVFDEKLAGHLFVSRLNPYQERKLVLIGSKASLIFDDLKDWSEKIMVKNYTIDQTSDPTNFSLAPGEYFPVNMAMCLTRELEHFIDAVQHRTQPLNSGEEAVNILRILSGDMIKESKEYEK